MVVNSRTGQELPMGVEVLDDLEANAEALDVGSGGGAGAGAVADRARDGGRDGAGAGGGDAAGGARAASEPGRRELLEIPKARATPSAPSTRSRAPPRS